MKLDDLKKEIKGFLKEKDLKLYDVSYDKKDGILSIILDETLEMKRLEEVSQLLSDFMDMHDEDFDNYILDVSNIGLERPIRNKKEREDAVGAYVYVKTKDSEYNGTLEKYEAGILTVSYKDKTRSKKVDIGEKEIKEMRYAVNF